MHMHGLIGSYRERELHNTVMRTFLVHFHGRAIVDQGTRFFAYILLIIEFKGIVIRLKKVQLTTSVEYLIFTICSMFHS